MLCMDAQRISWDDLSYFLSVAREGTFSGAAAELGVNHATVQRRLGRLEEQLSTVLVHRSPQGCELTEAGLELLEHVRVMEREALAVERKAVGRDGRLSGEIRVATVDDFCVTALPPVLAAFRALHPEVSVELLVQSDYMDLAKLEADIAIRFGRRPDDAKVVARRIGEVRPSLYASRDYARRHGLPSTSADLSQHDVVMGDERMESVEMEAFVLRWADPSRIAIRSGAMIPRLAAIRAGLGVGMLLTFVADSPELVRVPLDDEPEIRAPVWMALHSDVRRNARVRAFADFAYERLRDYLARHDERPG